MTTPETTTPTPPECCPICGALSMDQTYTDRRAYTCGAFWVCDDMPTWHAPCPHAFTAALRCHATLEPTPRERARETALAACLTEYQAVKASGGYEILDADFDTAAAIKARVDAVAALALLEPRP